MIRRVPIPWSTQSVKAASGVVSSERLVNCYLEANPANAKGPVTVYGDAGLKKLIESFGSGGHCRGLLFAGGLLFVVSGTSLYAVNQSLTRTLVGTVKGTGPVSMIKNSTQIGIATNAGWYYSTIATLSAPVLVDPTYFSSATYQDGYGILTEYGTERFWITNLDTGAGFATISGLDFSSADAFADNLVGCISDHRELLLFGEETFEGWSNVGDATFPFARTPGAFGEIGCAAAGSIAKRSNVVYWLGNDGAVWGMVGYQPQRISTPGIERAIRALQYHDRATAWCYSLQGHENYVLSFDSATFVYDITTGLWRERESWGEPRWRAQCHAQAWGMDIVGDYEEESLYALDMTTYLEGGTLPSIRTMQSAPLHNGGLRMIMHELFIDCEMGGVIGGGGTSWEDPQFMLSWSDDGGKTWSNERTASAGKTGEYTRRLTFTRLGSFRQRTIRLSAADPFSLTVVGAYVTLEDCA